VLAAAAQLPSAVQLSAIRLSSGGLTEFAAKHCPLGAARVIPGDRAGEAQVVRWCIAT
jgi:hypothetical protein